ncbi:MAG: DMT family transporter [Rhodospirillales bacterium]|nr:DMT family transporter [Rhodospirillales bacterium]
MLVPYLSRIGSMRGAKLIKNRLGMIDQSSSGGITHRRNEPVAGALWMLLSCALLAGLAAIGRYVAIEGVPPLQVMFLRVLFALIAMSPWLMFRGIDLMRTEQVKVYGIRVIAGIAAMTTWFSAIALIPIGDVTAISFLAPIFTTIGAGLILGEVVRARRWIATTVGLMGALVILRPGMVEFGTGGWLALASAVAMGTSSLILKSLTNNDDPDKVVFISTAAMTPITFVFALFVWEWPEARLWPFLIAMGPVALLGHLALTRALAATDASLVMGFDFARLPFAVLLGFIVFGEIIDLWTWVGAAIIFCASAYIMRREAQLRGTKTRWKWPWVAGRLTR